VRVFGLDSNVFHHIGRLPGRIFTLRPGAIDMTKQHNQHEAQKNKSEKIEMAQY
jgi:hypothetical protein